MEKIGLSDIMARFEAGHGGAWWSMVESGGEWYEPCTAMVSPLFCGFRFRPSHEFLLLPRAAHYGS